jgi:formyltetrahydrofolate deformylase
VTVQNSIILTITCPDRVGIVAAVTGFLSAQGGYIIEAAQYGDPDSQTFFQRIVFRRGERSPDLEGFRRLFAPIAESFQMRFQMHDAARKTRVAILVSKFGHCLNDLLHRHQSGTLEAEVVTVISNHPDMRALVEWHGIDYHHLPVTPATKAEQEKQIEAVLARYDVELTVLARYMQVLSPELSAALAGRCINIHHSFLPSFKGAKPYHQAHARGVKLIGATAHYVTDNLDEGPIIEQEVARVDHTYSAEDYVKIGSDIESVVLARAVRYHAEHRVLLNGMKTVVFK